jgi:hypothetical protein
VKKTVQSRLIVLITGESIRVKSSYRKPTILMEFEKITCLFPSIVGQYRKPFSKVNYLDMKKGVFTSADSMELSLME